LYRSRKSSASAAMTPVGKKSRQSSVATSKSSVPASRRYSSVPQGASVTSRKTTPSARLDFTPSRAMSGTAASAGRAKTPTDRSGPKPRWNSDTHLRDTVTGHLYRPLTLTPPSRGSESPDPSRRGSGSRSALPTKSPLSRSALSPSVSGRSSTTPSQQQRPARSLASPMQSPATPAKGKLPLRSTPTSSKPSTPASSRRVTALAEDTGNTSTEESPAARRASRPPSVSANRRSSLLTTKTGSAAKMPDLGRSGSRLGSVAEGRDSRVSVSGRQSSAGDRKGWR
jgi:hypothetical protein